MQLLLSGSSTHARDTITNECLNHPNDPCHLFRCHTIVNGVNIRSKHLNTTRAIGKIKENHAQTRGIADYLEPVRPLLA